MKMKREDFKKIIKLRSCWTIDRRKGNYKLPSGEWLSAYVARLIDSQMQLDSLLIGENGDLYTCISEEVKDGLPEYTFLRLGKDETCTFEDQEQRKRKILREIIG